MGGSRRTKEEEEAEGKDGTEGRHFGCLRMCLYTIIPSITTNYFAAFVEEKTTNKISK